MIVHWSAVQWNAVTLHLSAFKCIESSVTVRDWSRCGITIQFLCNPSLLQHFCTVMYCTILGCTASICTVLYCTAAIPIIHFGAHTALLETQPQRSSSIYSLIELVQVWIPAQALNLGIVVSALGSYRGAPLFRQPLTKGSWDGLVTLTAYMAVKIGIEKNLMEKF